MDQEVLKFVLLVSLCSPQLFAINNGLAVEAKQNPYWVPPRKKKRRIRSRGRRRKWIR